MKDNLLKKEKTAREMFEDLGYQEIKPFAMVRKTYRKIWGTYESINDVKEEINETGKLRFFYIDFNQLLENGVNLSLIDVKAKIENNEVLTEEYGESIGFHSWVDLSIKELQAINKQIEELGW